MSDTIKVLAAICDHANQDGSVYNPRFASQEDFDFSKFKKQECSIEGIEFEYVDQRGPGQMGDEFYGTIAFPVDGTFFLVDFG